jgi:ferredoxin
LSGTAIYYFSGSGNSLYVAKELHRRIPGSELIPIIGLLSKDIIETRASTVGFVFPIHGLTVPIPVKKFMKKFGVNSTVYLFAVATRGGTWHNAFSEIDKTLGKSGKRLDACFSINMASNDPKFKDWRPPTEEELIKMGSETSVKLDALQKIITEKEHWVENVNDGALAHVGFFIKIFALSGMFFVEHTGLNNYFYWDAKCVGCGICEKVCPSLKVKMVGKSPQWQNDVKCYFCYACVNYCPKKAVQIKSKVYMKSYTDVNERYPHPYATANDIADQKLIKGR